jgi:hypothetical protein
VVLLNSLRLDDFKNSVLNLHFQIVSFRLSHFTAYIDEAGDEGFGKLAAGPVGGQSRWLMLGACLVSREHDLRLPFWRDQILARFPNRRNRDLHFRFLKHDQKVVVCQEIARLPIRACVTMSHKVTIPGSPWEETFKRKNYLYNYLIRWLLERLTTYCAREARDARLRIVFSRRASTDYAQMKNYLQFIRDGGEIVRPVRSINWQVLNLDDLAVEDHSRWAGLPIADVITSAVFMGFEPNYYGNYEPSYVRLLKDNFIASHGYRLNTGIVPVPSLDKCAADQHQLSLFMELNRNERVPGS